MNGTLSILATGILALSMSFPRVYKLGGRVNNDPVKRTRVLDMGANAPGAWLWTELGEMNLPRQECDFVILPNGWILVVGGAMSSNSRLNPAMKGQLFNTWTNTWGVETPEMLKGRMYHSIAILLPDGSVLVAGGEEDDPANPGPAGRMYYADAQIYYPPYFNANRPTITSPGGVVEYNTSYRVTFSHYDEGADPIPISRVTLVGLGSVTHSWDMNQRFINLTFDGDPTENEVLVYTPKNGGVAPPGWYMLFVVDENDVPSFAKFVKLVSPFQ